MTSADGRRWRLRRGSLLHLYAPRRHESSGRSSLVACRESLLKDKHLRVATREIKLPDQQLSVFSSISPFERRTCHRQSQSRQHAYSNTEITTANRSRAPRSSCNRSSRRAASFRAVSWISPRESSESDRGAITSADARPPINKFRSAEIVSAITERKKGTAGVRGRKKSRQMEAEGCPRALCPVVNRPMLSAAFEGAAAAATFDYKSQPTPLPSRG